MKTFIQNNKRVLLLVLMSVMLVCLFTGYMLTASAFSLATSYSVTYKQYDAEEAGHKFNLSHDALMSLGVSGTQEIYAMSLNGDYYNKANIATSMTVSELAISSLKPESDHSESAYNITYLYYRAPGDANWTAMNCFAEKTSSTKYLVAPMRIYEEGTYEFCTVNFIEDIEMGGIDCIGRSAIFTITLEHTTDADYYVFEPDQNQSGMPNSWEAPSSYVSIREVTFLSDNTFKCVFDTLDTSNGYTTAYLWFATDDMTEVPVDGMSSQTAYLLDNVAPMVMDEGNERYTFYITLDQLSTLDADVPTEVHFAICREPSQETYLWEMHGSIGTITRTELTRYPLPVEPTKAGYRFTGWFLDEACTQPYTEDYVTEDIVLYAGFEPIKTVIKFNANGGEGSMTNMETVWGKTTNLPGCRFERAGYKFLGWATSAGGPVVYKDNTDIMTSEAMGETFTLYAVWEQITCKVTFIVDGEVYAVVNVTPGTSTDDVIAGAVNTLLYEVDGEYPLE